MQLTRTHIVLILSLMAGSAIALDRLAAARPASSDQPSAQPLQLTSAVPKTWLVDSEVAAVYLDMTWQVEEDSRPVASQSEVCDPLNRSAGIRVMLGAQSDARKQQVQGFLQDNPNLPGTFCTNPRKRRVWMSQRIDDINTAIAFFERAIAVGVVHPVKVTRLP